MTPVRVLYLTPSVRMLGARQSLLQLVRALDRSRFEPVVACPSRGGLADVLEAEGVAVEIVKLRPWRKGKSWPFIPWTVARLRRIVRERGVGLLHCNEMYPAPYATLAAAGLPVVSHVRLERTPRMARKYWLHKSGRVLCVSDAVRRSLFEGGGSSGIEPERALVVHNGIDLKSFASGVDMPAERKAIRKLLRVGENDFILGQFGLLSERKNHRDAFEALGAWKASSPGEARRAIYLVIGDEGPRDPGFAKSLRESAKALGLSVQEGESAPISASEGPRVVFLPFREDIARFYAALDCCLLPSSREGFGRVLVEAAAFGVPSIGSRAGGIPEVVADGETGWLFDVGDREGLLARLREAANDPGERQRRGSLALERARARFSQEACAGRIQEIYEELLAESSRQRK